MALALYSEPVRQAGGYIYRIVDADLTDRHQLLLPGGLCCSQGIEPDLPTWLGSCIYQVLLIYAGGDTRLANPPRYPGLLQEWGIEGDRLESFAICHHDAGTL